MSDKMPVNINHIELAHDLALMGDVDAVASKYGLLPSDVNKLMKQDDFKEILAEFQDTMINEARHYIISRAKPAVKTISTIMTNESVKPNTRLSAAKDLLDRAGLVAKKSIDINKKSTYEFISDLSDEELDKMIKESEQDDVIDI